MSASDLGRPSADQRGSCRTSGEGPRLHAGWKSNVSQQEEKAEFIEDIESERCVLGGGEGNTDGHPGDSERKDHESRFCLGPGAFY